MILQIKDSYKSDIETEYVDENIKKVRENLEKCLDKVNSIHLVPINLFERITIDKPYAKTKIEKEEIEAILKEENTDNPNVDPSPGPSPKPIINPIPPPIPEPNTDANMSFEYIGNLSRVIKDQYDGDPLKLEPFITAIELANAASTAAQQETLVKFIKTKLTGKALETLPAEVQTATGIITALRNKIKPENTKVVMGRLLALRADKTSLIKFQE